MRRYRTRARIGVTAALGIVDNALIREEAPSALDKAIAQAGSRCLDGVPLEAFYFAFYCNDDWASIEELFATALDRPIDAASAERRGRDALRTLRKEASTAPELLEWVKTYCKPGGEGKE